MDYFKIYADFLGKFFPPEACARGPSASGGDQPWAEKLQSQVKVIFDCSNGVAGLVLKKLFKNHRFIDPKLIDAKPDGRFLAHSPDPLKAEALRHLSLSVSRYHADLGVIFDADGDRVFFADDRDRLVLPDQAAIALAMNFKGAVILDIRSGYAIREWLEAQNRRVVDSRVGHYFIKKLMRKRKIAFGAETSGHYYFSAKSGSLPVPASPAGRRQAGASGGKDTFYFDSGIFAAIQMINRVSGMKKQGLKFSEWIDHLPRYYRISEKNFRVSDMNSVIAAVERRFRNRAKHISKIDGLKMEFGAGENSWWFNLRSSQTEKLIRLNAEAKNSRVLRERVTEIKNFL